MAGPNSFPSGIPGYGEPGYGPRGVNETSQLLSAQSRISQPRLQTPFTSSPPTIALMGSEMRAPIDPALFIDPKLTMSSSPLGGHGGPVYPGGGIPLPASFVPPVHVELQPSRIKDAGYTRHPDPNFRPYGPNQWVDILYNHTLLRYISKNEITDIRKHCEKLAQAVNPDDPRPVLIDNGPFTTADAQAVWKYCTVYIKRRDQLRNNVSARKSRSRKDNEVKHWKMIALAAGAPDVPFEFDGDDPAYSNEALVPRETQDAINAMRASWASSDNIQKSVKDEEAPVVPPEAALPPGQLPLPIFEGAMPPIVQDENSASTPAPHRPQTRATTRAQARGRGYDNGVGDQTAVGGARGRGRARVRSRQLGAGGDQATAVHHAPLLTASPVDQRLAPSTASPVPRAVPPTPSMMDHLRNQMVDREASQGSVLEDREETKVDWSEFQSGFV
ncbi:basic-leucine zipper transcription factor DNA binding nucleus regulation of transcription, DNA-dependent [Cryphonectria parasitica EP155]|uniref:Basic-leucine zipper transcription factor DNA binding nucleus regulation of transcription, DNA-dependent n=1 Tax=Cryphonectria parasitica (strain ATCC 38755 / EP155) TaxID=660469 RepID=A0A9P4Y7V4_CRYP1|nr:basic-leucine zipper transcription factor DNA binding nucleus regulation of transcription, DNA-dependent [Cryphonectria parasitica EP155]KAF3767967.1 basic-leucine zipper transcription factor DNA binding nucleus regulation of transcription, DNA-dependent [Cryphonectria parasitica EP155]